METQLFNIGDGLSIECNIHHLTGFEFETNEYPQLLQPAPANIHDELRRRAALATLKQSLPIAYKSWGVLNATRTNCVVVCHALTGHADVTNWWNDIVGAGKVFDTDKYFVVCFNMFGSPYGSASSLTINPETNEPYGADFPVATIRDSVKAHMRALKELFDVTSVHTVVGASLGGMQAFEWAILGGDLVKSVILIATCAQFSAWCIGWNEAQRQAIYCDPNWKHGRYSQDAPPAAGLSTARMIAMLTYRSASSFADRFGRQVQDPNQLTAKYYTYAPETDPYFFNVQSYLRYQGRKLVQRFDANCYVRLTQAMDTHDVARGRDSIQSTLATIQQACLWVCIDSDLLYTVHDQQLSASSMPNCSFLTISADDGHDGFLIKSEQLNLSMTQFIEAQPAPLL